MKLPDSVSAAQEKAIFDLQKRLAQTDRALAEAKADRFALQEEANVLGHRLNLI